jgi:hypothetical protein
MTEMIGRDIEGMQFLSTPRREVGEVILYPDQKSASVEVTCGNTASGKRKSERFESGRS